MAHGRKRICVGGLLVTTTLAIVAAIIATRWHRFTIGRYGWPGPILVDFTHGTCLWKRYHQSDPASPPQPSIQFDHDRQSALGPLLLLEAQPTRPSILSRPLPDHLKPLKVWRLGWLFTDADSTNIGHVAWPIPLATALLGGLTIRSGLRTRRRLRFRHHCPNCNYDRSATPASVRCPECGRLPDARVALTTSTPEDV